MQSKQLTEFYQAYAKWLDDEAPQNMPFIRHAGLCYNIHTFAEDNTALIKALHIEMRGQFDRADLDYSTPFNDDDNNNYSDESDACSMHLNEARILWVRSHVNG